MVTNRDRDCGSAAASQSTDELTPKPNPLHICWKSIHFHIQKHCQGTEACLALPSLWTARVARAVLALAVLVTPGFIEGKPRAPVDGILPLGGTLLSGGVAQVSPEGAPQLSFYETSSVSEPSVVVESTGAEETEGRSGDSVAMEPRLMDAEDFQLTLPDVALSPSPVELRGLDEIVPFLLPMRPFAPRFSSFNTSGGIPAFDGDSREFAPAPTPDSPLRSAFYGPQSDDVHVDGCQHFDAFLVSPLPSSVASRFKEFVQKEATQVDGMPYLHHIHGRAATEPADGEENPRLVVEGGKVTPLWSEDTDGERTQD